MRDLDLGVLETLIVFFLFMPVIRPFVKSLWKARGIVLLPFIAFLCAVGIFLAYGFRPECVPLLLYIIIVNISNTGNVLNCLTSVRGVYIEKNIPLFFVHILFLGCAAALALIFLPYSAGESVSGSGGFTSENVQTAEARDRSSGMLYTMRIYGGSIPAKTGGTPETGGLAILVAPPVLGSSAVVDTFCAALQTRALQARAAGGNLPKHGIQRPAAFAPANAAAPAAVADAQAVSANAAANAAAAGGGGGSVVVSFSQAGFDVPAWGKTGSPILPPPEQIIRAWRVLTRALKTQKENSLGGEMEAERLRGLRFMMNWLKKNGNYGAVIIAGYGVSGGAAITLASDAAFVAEHPEFRGVLAIETYLYGAFAAGPEQTAAAEPEQTAAAAAAAAATAGGGEGEGFSGFAPLDTALAKARAWLVQKIPVKIHGVTETPKPLVPVRFIVSGYDTENERYIAARKTATGSRGLARVRATANTSVFDWTDVPQKYPVLRFAAAPFKEHAWTEENAVAGAANALWRCAEEMLPPQ